MTEYADKFTADSNLDNLIVSASLVEPVVTVHLKCTAERRAGSSPAGGGIVGSRVRSAVNKECTQEGSKGFTTYQ